MPEIMSRGDVVNTIAAEVDLPQAKVDQIIKSFEGTIKRQAATGGEVRMTGFGSFKVTHRAARTSRNPQTGDPVEVAERNAIRFVPGKDLKDAAASSLQTQAAPKKAAKVKAADASSDGAVKADAKTEKKPAKPKKK